MHKKLQKISLAANVPQCYSPIFEGLDIVGLRRAVYWVVHNINLILAVDSAVCNQRTDSHNGVLIIITYGSIGQI